MDYGRLLELRSTGFMKDVGIRIVDIQQGYAKGELVLQEKHKNPIQSVHGGVLFTLADTIGGTAATSWGRWVTTVSGNINYLNAAIDCNKLIAETREIKVGKNLCVYEVTITNENDKIICMAVLTYYYVSFQVE